MAHAHLLMERIRFHHYLHNGEILIDVRLSKSVSRDHAGAFIVLACWSLAKAELTVNIFGVLSSLQFVA